jgi:hypothetical protein
VSDTGSAHWASSFLSRYKNCLWQPCLLMDQNEMSNFYRGPSIDASYQVSYHLAKWLQRKSCFRNRPIRNKNCLWWSCLLTDQNGMSNSHRGPSIDASYHVSVHLAKLLQCWNLVGCIYGRSSINLANFVPIH